MYPQYWIPGIGGIAIALGSRTRYLSGYLQTFLLTHGLLTANDHGDRTVHDAIQIAFAGSRLDNFSGKLGMSNWEQKFVEFRLYRDSTIFSKIPGSCFIQGI